MFTNMYVYKYRCELLESEVGTHLQQDESVRGDTFQNVPEVSRRPRREPRIVLGKIFHSFPSIFVRGSFKSIDRSSLLGNASRTTISNYPES